MRNKKAIFLERRRWKYAGMEFGKSKNFICRMWTKNGIILNQREAIAHENPTKENIQASNHDVSVIELFDMLPKDLRPISDLIDEHEAARH